MIIARCKKNISLLIVLTIQFNIFRLVTALLIVCLFILFFSDAVFNITDEFLFRANIYGAIVLLATFNVYLLPREAKYHLLCMEPCGDN